VWPGQRGEINKQRREEVQDIHMPEGREAERDGHRQIHNTGKKWVNGEPWKQLDEKEQPK
jgi:hypothetical protein